MLAQEEALGGQHGPPKADCPGPRASAASDRPRQRPCPARSWPAVGGWGAFAGGPPVGRCPRCGPPLATMPSASIRDHWILPVVTPLHWNRPVMSTIDSIGAHWTHGVLPHNDTVELLQVEPALMLDLHGWAHGSLPTHPSRALALDRSTDLRIHDIQGLPKDRRPDIVTSPLTISGPLKTRSRRKPAL